MIQGCQIRAARALLNMNQEELATAAGLTPQAIRKIENGDVQPREGTISDIKNVFNNRGIEFLDNSGVRYKPRQIEVYEGDKEFRKFMDDIYEVAQNGNTEICISGVEEHNFIKHLGTDFSDIHIRRMSKLTNTKVRCLIKEGDTDVYCDSYNEYKWVPSDLFSAVPFYVYGNKFAVVLFEDGKATVVVIESTPVAKAYKKQFELIWSKAKTINTNNN